jgi:hypothetical protein
LAALREKKTALAGTQLMELVAEFPQNPLFASELAKLPDAAAPPWFFRRTDGFKLAPERVGSARAWRVSEHSVLEPQ